MFQPHQNMGIKWYFAILIFCAGGVSQAVQPPEFARSSEAPCAVLEKFSGAVQLLNATRTEVTPPAASLAIPCGSWISTQVGWARIHDREGNRFYLNSGTLMQFREEPIVFYQGQVYFYAQSGDGELILITASARARLKRASGMLTVRAGEVQLMAFEGKAILENRFQPSAYAQVSAGEATSLKSSTLRVAPTAPQAVALVPLEQSLIEMNLDERELKFALQVARDRQDRKFPPLPHRTSEENRRPAGLEIDPQLDAQLQEHWMNKMVGHQKEGRKMLYPDQFHGRPQKVKVSVEDPLKERSRLLQELSEIQTE